MEQKFAAGLAELNEAEALRRRFDERNAAALAWILRFAAIPALVYASAISTGWGLVLLSFLAAAIFSRARSTEPPRGLWRWLGILDGPAALLGRRLRGATLSVVVLLYGAIIAQGSAAGDVDPWVAMLPWILLVLLLPATERLLLHLALFLGTVLVGLLGQPANPSELMAISGVVNAMAAGIGLGINRASRKTFLRTWGAARHNYLERQRLQGELDYAREIQLGMLPRSSPDLPWLEVSGFSLPAMEVGGDYYDYVVLDPDRVVIVTADVAGHGLGSALMVSGLRSCVKLLAPEIADGPRVMGRLSGMVRETTRRHMKVSLSLALLDRQAGTVTVTSAGQPPALVWRGATGKVELLEMEALPLGTRLRQDYPTREVPLHREDLLVLYTDGVYEMPGAADAPYGLDRLVALVESGGSWADPAGLREAILKDLWVHKGTRAQEDDVTLLVVRAG